MQKITQLRSLTDEQIIESVVGNDKVDELEDYSVPTESSSRKEDIKAPMVLNTFLLT